MTELAVKAAGSFTTIGWEQIGSIRQLAILLALLFQLPLILVLSTITDLWPFSEPAPALIIQSSIAISIISGVALYLQAVRTRHDVGPYIVSIEDMRGVGGWLQVSYVTSRGKKRESLAIKTVKAHPDDLFY